MQIHRNIDRIAHGFAHRSNARHHKIYCLWRIDKSHRTRRRPHLHSSKTFCHLLACNLRTFFWRRPTRPSVHANAVANFPTQKFPYRQPNTFAKHIPHRHLNPTQRTDQHRHTPAITRAIHRLPVIFDIQRIFAHQVLGHIIDSLSHHAPMLVIHRLAIPHQSLIRKHLQNHCPTPNGNRFKSRNFHDKTCYCFFLASRIISAISPANRI